MSVLLIPPLAEARVIAPQVIPFGDLPIPDPLLVELRAAKKRQASEKLMFGATGNSCLLVVVHERRVDQVVEVHVRKFFFRGHRGGCRLPVALGFICQREQQF